MNVTNQKDSRMTPSIYANTTPRFEVTRRFFSGILKGLTHTEITTVAFKVGFRCAKPCGGTSGYEIVEVKQIA